MDDKPDEDDLKELLNPLSEAYRRDYAAVEIDGKSPSKHAQDLDIREATVFANVSRAKERLRDMYDLQEGESLANAYGEHNAVFLDTHSWTLIIENLQAAAALRQQQGGSKDAKKIRRVVSELQEQLGRQDPAET
jgi:hypothetical protein